MRPKPLCAVQATVDLADIKARVGDLIAHADQVELRLATREWSVRQQSLLLEEYLENSAQILSLVAEYAAWLKSQGGPRPERPRYYCEQTRRSSSSLMATLGGREGRMTDRLQVLSFLEDAATQMAQLARKDGIPQHVAAELGRIAAELGTEATQLKVELLDSLAAKVANSNRRGLTGLAD